MSKDVEIATITNGDITAYNENLLPLYLKRTRNFEGWLSSRAIDSHRTNSRLLKKALRLTTADDAQTVLTFNAATITDCYWFKPINSQLKFEEVRFKENYFDTLALRGDPDGFSAPTSRTPELTNTGSFEKCWRLIDGIWWMYKSGSPNEYFSELFICKLGEVIGLDMAHYEMDGDYIRTKNFVDTSKFNYEPVSSIMGTEEDYNKCFNTLFSISKDISIQYLKLIWMDTICYNMDRHTENFGFLRDITTGTIHSLAPNFDNNIALISRGYPKDVTRSKDGLILFFKDFLKENKTAVDFYREIDLPLISESIIHDCLENISIKVDERFIINFILNGYSIVNQMIKTID